ncbi:MAG TPA: CoA transferase [Methylomirabilota bacterium]|jgi:crotonobetainyl-CoA:carnitine CoA-transferase CaiB-like acyl-CoA transferase|nr:CoA transferase [Methylomirabilota bacterium]
MSGALSGIRVIDCARLIAGGVLATVLADHGADVVKVENPRGGDPLRTWLRDRGELWWKVYARGKRSVTLNLTDPRGQALLRRLVRDADVVIENYVPGTFERWGLGWDALSSENPRLIFARVSGWGQDGPYRDRPGFGTMVEAMSGFAHTTGDAAGPPTLPSFPMADMVAALAGCTAVLAALRHRDHVSGRGQVVDISLYEPLLSVLGPDAAAFALDGTVRERHGNTSDNASPRGTYRTRDGKWVALSASTPASAATLFTALGRADVLTDPRFATNDARVRHNELVDATLAEAISERTLDEMRALFESSDLTACPVYDIADITKDPHVVARGVLIDVPDPELGAVRMTAPTPRLAATPAGVRWPGPPLGAHNREVYGALGIAEAELEALKRDGVV